MNVPQNLYGLIARFATIRRKQRFKQGPWQAVVRCWKAHPRIAQFITYFMVGNLATVAQLVLIPVLQPILGAPAW